jgi:hypothetical protein
MRTVLIAAVLLGGCRCGSGGGEAEPDPGSGAGRGTGRGTGADASSDAFASLDGLPRIRPRWTRTLPEQPVPAIDVHGPRIVDGVAVVAGSAIGVVGVDLARGEVLWSRPAGAHVALPAVIGGKLLVAGDCTIPIDGDDVVGCYEVLDPRKQAVYGYGSIVSETALGAGPTELAVEGGAVYLGREGEYLRFTLPDPPRGEVRAEKTRWREVITVGEGDDKVEAWIVDDVLELRHHRPDVMSSRSAVRSIAGGPGALYLLASGRTRAFRYPDGVAEIQPVLIDLAAIEIADLGVAVPGIDLLAAAQGEKGYAIAVRLDSSLAHDYVARFGADGTLAWVWPLPPPPGGGRALPVGLAWTADDGLVVFHDGTTLAYLP